MRESVILNLVQIQNQFRFLHWQTNGYSKHKTYGKIYNDFGKLIDEFAESCMGKHGKFEFNSEFKIVFKDIKSLNLQKFIDNTTEYLISITEYYDPKEDSDLLNLRDEMLLKINKLKYFLTLK